MDGSESQQWASGFPKGESATDFQAMVLERLAAGAVAVDPQGRVVVLNPAAERWTGLSGLQVIGRGLECLPAALQQLLSDALTQGRRITREIRLADRDETMRPFQAECCVGRGVRNELTCALALFQDHLGVAEIEREIQGLERLANIGLLSATVAHEVKNALAFVKTFVELFAEGRHDPDAIPLLIREIRRIDLAVRRPLRWSQRPGQQGSPVDLHDLLEGCLRLIQPRLESQNIRLIRALEAGEAHVQGNDYELELAVINLLMNAIEAMPQGGTLTVGTANTPDGSEVIVSIEDTGPGIPAELESRLFDRFMTTKSEGTGLGLSTARQIIANHRGEIVGQNRPDPEPIGARFQMRLPVRKSTAAES